MSSPFDLDGQVILVTGAGRGIGLACARAVADAGAEAVLMSRTGSELETAAADIRAAGGKARTMVCDVADTAAVRDAIGSLDRLDALINNAGTAKHAHFLEVDEDNYDQVMALNGRAAFFTAQAAARKIADGGRGGAIVNMSSQMGHVGGERRSVYCMSKHGLEGLTKVMAIELGPSNIRVNTLAPTFVETPLTRPFFDNPEFVAWLERNILMGRVAQPEEIAAAAVYLCSPAASMVTGTCLKVDGGWTAH